MEGLISNPKPSLINPKFSKKQPAPNTSQTYTYPSNQITSRISSSHGKKDSNYSSYRPGTSNLTTLEEDNTIKKAFNLLDPKRIDYVNRDELITILQEVKSQSKDLSTTQIIEKLRKMQEFSKVFLVENSSFKDMMDTKKVFDLFDNNEKGYISIQNLKEINDQLGKTKSGNQLIEMIRVADSDGDWLVTLEDLHNILKKATVNFLA